MENIGNLVWQATVFVDGIEFVDFIKNEIIYNYIIIKMFYSSFTKNFTIIYHSSCPDGACSAWCFQHYVESNPDFFSNCTFDYFEVDYDTQEIPKVFGKTVIILDFCYYSCDLAKIVKDADFTLIIDHHETSQEHIYDCERIVGKEKFQYILDMDRSGCQITWDTFIEKERPWFVNYIGDHDLLNWELPGSREANKALYILYNIESLDNFNKLWQDSKDEEHLEKMIEYGKICKNYEQTIALKIKNNAMKMVFEGYNVLATSCPFMYRNEVGEQLCKDEWASFAVLFTYVPRKSPTKPGFFSVSLRGIEGKSPNLINIVKKYGGGGKKMACGFQCSNIDEFMIRA